MGSCCSTGTDENKPYKETKSNFIPAGGFHNDIVYYKFLNTDRYELHMTHLQVWIFDKNKTCIHATDNKFKAEHYVGKQLNEINSEQDIFDTFVDIHELALSGIESKRTVMYNNQLAYIECRTLYYNEDINDIYGTMLLYIPYTNVHAVRASGDGRSSNPGFRLSDENARLSNDLKKTAQRGWNNLSLDVPSKPAVTETLPQLKRTLSGTLLTKQ